jgi:lysophospholipase L1-like esterase
MRGANVPINDLYVALSEPGEQLALEDLLGSDGVHLQPKTKDRIGKTVVDFIGSYLPSRRQ